MLAIKRLAGVAPEVFLRNPFHTGDETCKQGIQPGFETQARNHLNAYTGVPTVPQKGPMSSKFFFKKDINTSGNMILMTTNRLYEIWCHCYNCTMFTPLLNLMKLICCDKISQSQSHRVNNPLIRLRLRSKSNRHHSRTV